MQFWVYILRCRDGSYYTGHTDDLEKRLWEHREGLASDWTKRRRPVELVWCDWTGERYDALAFERRVKNWSRAKKQALIAGDWERVGYFARPPHERPSTTLGTNGLDVSRIGPSTSEPAPTSFVPSEVEARPSASVKNTP
ncbi:GIY-YIG nuclease family protein [Sphingosinicella humi]|uniref:GIY-YIG nuclease family protein n=1 Tax=Allosphingosinicella humi TaxID=2068657 RepID=A0A2U2IYU1_9SPHN|nr:GIY-YIG nuclease family protein [Sphingosinicella humi]PWG01263.1 GIY-YIG nuclease family protein [Sphingosinicella humi]